jgi:tRNA threonylcarbamoyl adenosine modification protein (Sua5/YciO/YrdC/YwlC family)
MNNDIPIRQQPQANPLNNSVAEAARILNGGGVIAMPTDTLYAFACALGQDDAMNRICSLRGIADPGKRPLTFLLPDLGEIARWAQVSKHAYQILDRIFPGPFCVELNVAPQARERVPGKRSTIGIRIPNDPFCEKLLWTLGTPILSVTAKDLAGNGLYTADAIREAFGDKLDLVIDGGRQEGLPSTVVSLRDDWVDVLREGRGSTTQILVS